MPTEAEVRANQSVERNLREIIGQGIDFPYRYVQGGKVNSIQTSNAGERIKDSIHLILSTGIGERMFNPEFGSRLPQLVFEPNDLELKGVLKFYTAQALARWEKRIEIGNISFMDDYRDDNNTIGIRIEYTIRNSHIRGSYVYPFSLGGMATGDQYTGVEISNMSNPATVR
jgi:phage baseplate assembly protein W